MGIGRPEISRKRPGCFLFLLDQSRSMAGTFVDSSHSKADALALAVNVAIQRLILNCMPDGEPVDYYHVAAIGYGGERVELAFGGSLEGQQFVRISELAEHPMRYAMDSDATERPVWVEPRAHGRTPMCKALATARAAVEDWVGDFPESAPPIVLNVTDGFASDGDPDEEAHRLMGVATRQGSTLLLNLQLSSRPLPPVLFPSNDLDIAFPQSRALFYMSSPLPNYMVEVARTLGIPLAEQARGFGCNADVTTLLHFIQLGTTPTLPAR